MQLLGLSCLNRCCVFVWNALLHTDIPFHILSNGFRVARVRWKCVARTQLQNYRGVGVEICSLLPDVCQDVERPIMCVRQYQALVWNDIHIGFSLALQGHWQLRAWLLDGHHIVTHYSNSTHFYLFITDAVCICSLRSGRHRTSFACCCFIGPSSWAPAGTLSGCGNIPFVLCWVCSFCISNCKIAIEPWIKSFVSRKLRPHQLFARDCGRSVYEQNLLSAAIGRL